MASAVRLKFDLARLLEKNFSISQRKALTPLISDVGVKREFGNRAIEAIIKRTLSGKDKDGTGFTAYSKIYKDSLAFKVHGKSSRVNLRLTGAMQADISVTKTIGSTVEIGFTQGTENSKASGHINGAGNLPVRDFWGLSDSDQSKIFKSVVKDKNRRRDGLDFIESLALIGDAAVQASTAIAATESEDAISVTDIAILGNLL